MKTTIKSLRKLRTGTFIETRVAAGDVSCFMPNCLNNLLGYCQCKSDNITPGDVGCERLTEPKGILQ